jgi:signal peptidase I
MPTTPYKPPHLKQKTTDPKMFINYMGPSMKFTFQPGDNMHVVPYVKRKVRRGDVIVFLPPGKDLKVVHRVVSIDPDGIRTKGDNNPFVDTWLLSPEHIIGRVAYAQRRRAWRRIYGGTTGRVWKWMVRAVRLIQKGAYPFVRPPYRLMLRARAIRRWLFRWVPTRVISIERDRGVELQFLVGRHVVGRLLPGRKTWQIRPPFRLIVPDDSLPQ